MNLDLGEQQRVLEESVTKFLAANATPREVRAAEPLGFSPALWRGLAELGIPMMRAATASGGSDASLLDAVIVATAAGRHVAPAPISEVMVAARVLATAGSDTQPLLGRIASGDAIVSLALHEVRAGEAQIVPAGAVADAVLCFEGDELALIERPSGARRNAIPDIAANPSALPVERWLLARADAGTYRKVIARGPEARALYGGAVEEWRILRAAALVGAGRRAVEMAADYARERQQFGRPIGSFQGVAHPLADSITDLEGARLLLWWAVWANARGHEDAAAAVSMASWWAADASRRAVRRALRTFGGYGLSVEYDVQFYFRRVNALALLGGDPENDLREAGDRLWLGQTRAQPPAGAMDLELGLGAEAEKFAGEARAFFRKHMTPDLRAKAHHSTSGHDVAFHKKLAAAGFAYPDWPKAWGGQDRSPFEVAALARVFEEFRWTRTTIGITNMGARMVMQFGSPELQRKVLPSLASGAALSCLGFTESSSGSDMFAAQTRAVRDGADWIINGHKMFTTGADIADYVLLLTRTDPAAPKHKGLTIFFVPLKSPGVEVRPLHTLQDERTNITHYTDVRVPDRYRLGEVNGGLKVMAAAMALEHGGDGYHVMQLSLLDAAQTWARTKTANGRPVDDPAVRTRLAKVAVLTQVSDLLCKRALWVGHSKSADRAAGPMSKMFSTEACLANAADLTALAAPDSILPGTDPVKEIEDKHRHSIGQTIYGGTSEVHRGIVAEYALNLPKSG